MSGANAVWYTTRWSEFKRRPVPGHDWLSEDRARELLESGEVLVVIDAEVVDDEGLPLPRWTIGGRRGGRYRVSFYDEDQNLWRQIDYDAIDGRLWRWIGRHYYYPEKKYYRLLSDADRIIKDKFRPDGTGTVEIKDKSEPKVEVFTLQEAPVDGFWMDQPAFGEWDQLADPDYGVPSVDRRSR